MTIAIFLILLIHGLIHLIGFMQAFRPKPETKVEISRPKGIFWLLTTVVFGVAAVMYVIHIDLWWIATLVGLTFSQTMIFTAWKTSRAGTFINIIVLAIVIVSAADMHFRSGFKKDTEVLLALKHNTPILEETDIASLPAPVKNYIRNSGCIGKPKVYNFRAEFSGELRQNDTSEWMPFTSVQYNFMDPVTRLFFLRATMKHLSVAGYHRYSDGKATMDIRLLSLFTVQEQSGEIMDKAETVTFFNDMCVIAPATLIDHRVTWLGTNGDTVFAKFTGPSHTISASLIFDHNGELVNFISADRGAVQDDGTMTLAPWMTPMNNPKIFSGIRLASEAETIYRYPDGDFCYGKFVLEDVKFNCTTFSQ